LALQLPELSLSFGMGQAAPGRLSLRNLAGHWNGTKMSRIPQLLIVTVFAAVASFASSASAAGPGLSSDFNNDHAVDGLDLAQWNASYGPGAGADANGDAVSDGADFLAWQRQLGSVESADVEISHNPEPAAIVVWGALATAVGLGISVRRRREQAE
jgi:hypothetical protein